MYSYHIFYFPFKWEIPELKSALFSEQVDLKKLHVDPLSSWERGTIIDNPAEGDELYNEKNYYYNFVHPVLYDEQNDKDAIIFHFERKEPKRGGVYYIIKKKNGKEYRLRVDAMNLNFYSTGVGTLSFYLVNEEESQKSAEDILNINQYGRRIMPPFIGDVDSRYEIAEYLEITGLDSTCNRYFEDFKQYKNTDFWKPADFIIQLIQDLDDRLIITPVIDDRMFVVCWYANNDIAGNIKTSAVVLNDYARKNEDEKFKKFLAGDFWYKYIYIDVSTPTCKNDEMRELLIKDSTYTRWQKDGRLFGASRYSFVVITPTDWFGTNLLPVHMRTIYSRMIELVLVQRASMLRFSGEVTRVSRLTGISSRHIAEKISSLYKEYIRFINQIYFREVTAQDQGIELYNLIHHNLKIADYVKDLDGEIEELHQYVSLMVDGDRDEKASILNKIATIFLPATIVTGFWGMNKVCEDMTLGYSLLLQALMIVIATILTYYFVLRDKKKNL